MPVKPEHGLLLAGGLALGALIVKLWSDHVKSAVMTSATQAVPAQQSSTPPVRHSIDEMVGNTPLVLIKSLSEATGCKIYGKAEYLNPGGSSKDRVALQIIKDNIASGVLKPGGVLCEGTSGSTGISLALLANAMGFKCHICMPDDQAMEKVTLLRQFGATVQLVKPVSIVNDEHYVNVARRLARQINAREAEAALGGAPAAFTTAAASGTTVSSAKDTALQEGRAASAASGGGGGGASAMPSAAASAHTTSSDSHRDASSAVFCDQFENLSNFKCHYSTTGPEIWKQTEGKLDAFVMGAGTGGTIAGVGTFLKEQAAAATSAASPSSAASAALSSPQPSSAAPPSPQRPTKQVMVFLTDPPGSSLFNKVTQGVAYASQQAERRLRRHRYDTIIEGVGIDRVTANFEKGLHCLDGAFRCEDREAVLMSRYVLQHDGLFIGSSTAMNLVGAVKAARKMGQGHTIVTLLCDSGLRHLSRFWNDSFLEQQGLLFPVMRHARGDLSFVA